LPDLVIIDGGKGQVSAAAGILRELGLTDVPLIGLAKRLEEVVVQDPVTGEFSISQLRADSQGLYLLQRVRDEAHRFAITYNRQMRSKRTIRSALDELPGIGPVKKKQLMRKFGSVAKIREAGLPEIEAVVGKAAGKVVKENL
jgi:excinuclease ABC subunit C